MILVWFFQIAGLVYFYQRINSLFKKVFIPSFLTGTLAFFLSVILGQLGGMAGLWRWTKEIPSPFIGQLPYYIPLGFFISFLFSEFFVGFGYTETNGIVKAGIGGIRCGIMIGIGQFISFFGMRSFFI